MRKSALRALQPAPSTSSSRPALPKCNPVPQRRLDQHPSITTSTCRRRTTVTSRWIVVLWQGATVPRRLAHTPSARLTLYPHWCGVSRACAAGYSISYHRRVSSSGRAVGGRSVESITPNASAPTGTVRMGQMSARCASAAQVHLHGAMVWRGDTPAAPQNT